MGTPAADETNSGTSDNWVVVQWCAGVARMRRPFKKYGNWACIAFAAAIAAATANLSCTLIAYGFAYWLAVCD
ncbi:MAG: hypothetical protein AAGH82_05990 [Pseudomonadota bacterium]